MTTLFLIVCLACPQWKDQDRVNLEGTVVLPSTPVTPSPIAVDLENVNGVPIDETSADLIGNFTFRNLTPGSYSVRVTQPGFIDFREEVRLPLTGRFVIGLKPLRESRETARPADGSYTVDLKELSLPRKARSEYEKGMNDHNAGDSFRAIKHFERALRISPNYYRAHLRLGREYEAVGRPAEAEAELRLAADLRPNESDPLSSLGEMQLKNNRFEEALQTFTSATARDPKAVAAAYGLGVSFYKLNRFDEAAHVLLHAQELESTNAAVRLMLINVFLKTKDWERVMIQADAYLKENPDGEQQDEVERIRQNVMEIWPGPGVQHR
jgi:Tfp pilus assembly protein PilF